jgi:hypothetical protein
MAADVPYSDDVQTNPDDQVAAHEDSYRNFIEMVYVGTLHVANFVVALAIGAVQGHWGLALFIMALATALSVYSLMTRAKVPLAGMTVFSLLALGAA